MRADGQQGLGGLRNSIVRLYAVMALADALGVLSAKLGLSGFSSSLFFFWFAVLPLPAGALCLTWGGSRIVGWSAFLSALACVALAVGASSRSFAVLGVALAGFANVVLQVAAPVWMAESLPAGRLAGVLTGGVFVKTLMAVAFPFAVAFASSAGFWPLALAPFALLAACEIRLMRSPCPLPRAPQMKPMGAFGRDVRRVLSDPVAVAAMAAFAVAVVADVLFNLSVPDVVARRFGSGEIAVALVYAVLFGVKLPVMLGGMWLFRRLDARRTFLPSVLVAVTGTGLMTAFGGSLACLVGVALFAAGFANVYGQIFDAVLSRQPAAAASVSSLLVLSISAGALASPILSAVRAWGGCTPEAAVFSLVSLLPPLAAVLGLSRSRS